MEYRIINYWELRRRKERIELWLLLLALGVTALVLARYIQELGIVR